MSARTSRATIRATGQAETTRRLDAMMEEIKKCKFDAKVVLFRLQFKVENIPSVKKCNPHHVIIGRAIKEAADPVAVARTFFEA